MMRHPNTDSLIGYVEGWLSADSKYSIAHHLGNCASCANEVSEWIALLGALKGYHLQSAPTDAVRACEDLYQVDRPSSKIREILAEIAVDTALVPAGAGVRGSSGSQQIFLRADDFDIHLLVSRSPRIILGQILHRRAEAFVSAARVRIVRTDEQLASAITDALGEFRLDYAPSGRLRFQADVAPDQRILADFTIKEISNA